MNNFVDLEKEWKLNQFQNVGAKVFENVPGKHRIPPHQENAYGADYQHHSNPIHRNRVSMDNPPGGGAGS